MRNQFKSTRVFICIKQGFVANLAHDVLKTVEQCTIDNIRCLLHNCGEYICLEKFTSINRMLLNLKLSVSWWFSYHVGVTYRGKDTCHT